MPEGILEPSNYPLLPSAKSSGERLGKTLSRGQRTGHPLESSWVGIPKPWHRANALKPSLLFLKPTPMLLHRKLNCRYLYATFWLVSSANHSAFQRKRKIHPILSGLSISSLVTSICVQKMEKGGPGGICRGFV